MMNIINDELYVNTETNNNTEKHTAKTKYFVFIYFLTFFLIFLLFAGLFIKNIFSHKKYINLTNNLLKNSKKVNYLQPFFQNNHKIKRKTLDIVLLNEQFFRKNSLILPRFLEINPIFLEYPYKYIVQGNGDDSLKLLSILFFNYPEAEFEIALENKINEADINKKLDLGTEIIIPKPSPYPYIKKYRDVKDIPHFDSKNDIIVDDNGVINGTAEEIEFYVHVVVAEASQQWDYEGTRMIAESITNRIRKTKESLHETLTKHRQYDVVENKLYLTVKISELQRKAAMDALKEKNNKYLTDDILFFATNEAVKRTPWFQKLKKFKEYRGVSFFSSTPQNIDDLLNQENEKKEDKIKNSSLEEEQASKDEKESESNNVDTESKEEPN